MRKRGQVLFNYNVRQARMDLEVREEWGSSNREVRKQHLKVDVESRLGIQREEEESKSRQGMLETCFCLLVDLGRRSKIRRVLE